MYWIGMDIGSTCTKAAVLDEKRDLIFRKAVSTGWDCVATADLLLEELKEQGIRREESRCVATGYGRVSVPCADKTVTEITCHAKGAAYLFGDQEFVVIDIGGQDTKVIEVRDGKVGQFIMNDKCAAGTGRFLEIMAGTLGMNIDALCEMARESRNHIAISSMCTVFAESEVISLIGKGTKKADIAYGVIESIAGKVKGQAGKLKVPLKKVYLTGGLCEVPLLLEVLSDRLAVPVSSCPEGRYAGAIGAALCAVSLKSKKEEC